LQRSYFAPQDTDSIEVTTAAHEIGAAAAAIKKAAERASENYRIALNIAAEELEKISDRLGDIRTICEKATWRNVVSEADKNNIAVQRDYVNAALAAVNSDAPKTLICKKAPMSWRLITPGRGNRGRRKFECGERIVKQNYRGAAAGRY